ncbi:CoA ester lyase [Solirubrobacter ginsenosidimutans]|uniref:CoA ester lyase n=1 Tax=Solirubrobacter ginsenosidimutans TaxID=490573 RepID=A0A9X3MN05_9ACTN|nr:CoA ester lyase [Solirubrobacter ginsenosidimutans]MDA0159234.1 CoA ester lyase [Solirubrobacter ginsenosidimutans]
MTAPRLLRSVLYTPGHRGDLIAKAPRYGADALCLVLEDSVPDELKPQARETVAASLTVPGAVVFVKVNPPGPGGLEDDLASIVRPGLAGIILPKVLAPADVHHADALLSAAEAEHGVEPGSVAILVLIETPLAGVRAFEIASASPRIVSLIPGAAANGDMARELGFQWTPEGIERLFLRSKVLMDQRAAEVPNPLDGIYGEVADLEGLEVEARHARQLGYRGKLVVHPSHVAIVNRVFTPSEAEVREHRRVLEAFDAALAEGSAAAVVDGRFIDYAMAATARQVLELAERAGVGA